MCWKNSLAFIDRFVDYAQTPLWMTVLVEGAFLAVVVLVVLGVVSGSGAGRRLPKARSSASRLSAGNRLLPTQVCSSRRFRSVRGTNRAGLAREESIHLARTSPR